MGVPDRAEMNQFFSNSSQGRSMVLKYKEKTDPEGRLKVQSKLEKECLES